MNTSMSRDDFAAVYELACNCWTFDQYLATYEICIRVMLKDSRVAIRAAGPSENPSYYRVKRPSRVWVFLRGTTYCAPKESGRYDVIELRHARERMVRCPSKINVCGCPTDLRNSGRQQDWAAAAHPWTLTWSWPFAPVYQACPG